MGAIETAMIDAAYAQVGKRLAMPTHTYLGASDSKLVDAQAGFESGVSALIGALAGINMISGAGMLDFLRAQSLEKLVVDAEIIAMVKRLLRGDSINNTEDRPALHSALRFEGEAQSDEQKEVAAALEKMDGLIKRVHGGEWKGHTGEVITDVVNIGIGGSDLGPRMVTKALTPYHTGDVDVHFVANIDGDNRIVR